MGVCVLHGSHAANHLEEVLRDQIGHVDCIVYNRPHITQRYIDVNDDMKRAALLLV
jgi:hypothetical protein